MAQERNIELSKKVQLFATQLAALGANATKIAELQAADVDFSDQIFKLNKKLKSLTRDQEKGVEDLKTQEGDITKIQGQIKKL